MKTIGMTTDGEYLVKMSEVEHEAFFRLQNTLAGKTHWELVSPTMDHRRSGLSDGERDMVTAIMAFVDLGSQVNSLKDIVADLDRVVMAGGTRAKEGKPSND